MATTCPIDDSKTRVKPETTTSSGKVTSELRHEIEIDRWRPSKQRSLHRRQTQPDRLFRKKPSSINSKNSDHRRLKSRVGGEVKDLNQRSKQSRRKWRYSAAESRIQSRRSRCYGSHRFPESKAGQPSVKQMRRRKQRPVRNTETRKPKKNIELSSSPNNSKPSERFFFDKKAWSFERTNLSLREERESAKNHFIINILCWYYPVPCEDFRHWYILHDIFLIYIYIYITLKHFKLLYKRFLNFLHQNFIKLNF